MSDQKMTGEEILQEALRQYSATYCDEFPPTEDDVHLSEDYQRKMEKLIQRSKNPFQRYFNTVGRRVAGIAAAILIFFGCSMTVSAVRKPVVEFLMNITGKYAWLLFDESFTQSGPNTIEVVYTLDAVPEGYELTDAKTFEKFVDFVWRNQNDEFIHFSQHTLKNKFVYDLEEAKYEIVISETGQKIFFLEKNEVKSFHWTTSDYVFDLSVSGEYSMDACLNMIKSIKEASPN